MKILQISDTHNQHRQLTDLPAADVIVHCGDFTDNGTEEEVLNFLNWFIELPRTITDWIWSGRNRRRYRRRWKPQVMTGKQLHGCWAYPGARFI